MTKLVCILTRARQDNVSTVIEYLILTCLIYVWPAIYDYWCIKNWHVQSTTSDH